jgi:hypothetical protein
MNFIDIFLTTLYAHFSSMQQRGRKVIPWLHTTFIVALDLTICCVSIANIIKPFHPKERVFLPVFVALGLLFFFVIKRYYFDSKKNIQLMEQYQNMYSSRKKLFLKILVLAIYSLIPFFLLFVIWLRA